MMQYSNSNYLPPRARVNIFVEWEEGGSPWMSYQ